MIWFGKVRIACLTQMWKHQDSNGLLYCYQRGKEDRSVTPVGIPGLLLLFVDQGTWNQLVNTAATTRAYCEIPEDVGVRITIEEGETNVLCASFAFNRANEVSSSGFGRLST